MILHYLFLLLLLGCYIEWSSATSQKQTLERATRFELIAWMNLYENRGHKDNAGSACDIGFRDWYKCDVKIQLTLLNYETGKWSAAFYPSWNKSDKFYRNTDFINQETFYNSGSEISLLVSETDQIFVNLYIEDDDLLFDDLIASEWMEIPWSQLTWYPKVFRVITRGDYQNGLRAFVSLKLKCPPYTCGVAPECYFQDDWRVCEDNQLTCLHWPFLQECKLLAGSFSISIHDAIVRLPNNSVAQNCRNSLSVFVLRQTEELRPNGLRLIYQSWKTESNVTESTVYRYLRVTNRIERILYIVFIWQSQCDDISQNAYVPHAISVNISDTLTKTNLPMNETFSKYKIEFNGVLKIQCTEGMTGPAC